MSFRSLLSLVLTLVVALAMLTTVAVAEEAMHIATHSDLNDATALANKNTVLRGNNAMVARSNVRVSQNDMLKTEQVEADVVPPGVQMMSASEPLKKSESKDLSEQMLLGGPVPIPGVPLIYRFRFRRGPVIGYRYPLFFWNTRGRLLFGHHCPFGRQIGIFFYC